MSLLLKDSIEGKKINIKELYNLPEKVVHCKKCVVSNQRPRITFDEHGVCSACNFAEEKNKKIDWDLREKELQDLCSVSDGNQIFEYLIEFSCINNMKANPFIWSV